jgi:hypothetical protein
MLQAALELGKRAMETPVKSSDEIMPLSAFVTSSPVRSLPLSSNMTQKH